MSQRYKGAKHEELGGINIFLDYYRNKQAA